VVAVNDRDERFPATFKAQLMRFCECTDTYVVTVKRSTVKVTRSRNVSAATDDLFIVTYATRDPLSRSDGQLDRKYKYEDIQLITCKTADRKLVFSTKY